MLSSSFVVVLLSVATLGQATVSVEAVISPPVIPFHRLATYAIIVEAPSDLGVALPDMTKAFGELSIYGMSEYRKEPLPGDRVRITETYTLDGIDMKDYSIHSAKVTWGEDQSVSTPLLLLRVRDLTEEERLAAAIFDGTIPGLRASPTGGVPGGWKIWAIAALTLLGLCALLVFLLREKRPAPDMAARKEPWEIAFERLRALDERRLPESGKFETYYVDLSAILRYYIEGRFYLHAPERTTPEFLLESTGQGLFDEGQEEFLGQFLKHCDYVKFAQYQPAIDEMGKSFSSVREFVEQTVPLPAEAVEGEAA